MSHDTFRFCPFCRAALTSGSDVCSNCKHGVSGFPVRVDAPEPHLDLPLRHHGFDALAAPPPAARPVRRPAYGRWVLAAALLASPGVVWMIDRSSREDATVAAADDRLQAPVVPFVTPEPVPTPGPGVVAAPQTADLAQPTMEPVLPGAAPGAVPSPVPVATPRPRPRPLPTPEPFRPEPPDFVPEAAPVRPAVVPASRAEARALPAGAIEDLEHDLEDAENDRRKLAERVDKLSRKLREEDDEDDFEKIRRQLAEAQTRLQESEAEVAQLRRSLSRLR